MKKVGSVCALPTFFATKNTAVKKNFKTYKASAGSGKTTSLVAEYLSICLHSEHTLGEYRHILAITFTHNATAEMKSRIVHTLNEFAFLPQEDWGGSERAIFDMILKAEPQLDLPTVRNRSERLLAEILYDYPNFSISTIDSFFQRIVRAFAFELGISMSYEVEVTLDDCYQQSVDLLLSRISNDNPQLRERIFQVVNQQMEEEGRWRIEDALCEILSSAYGDENSAEPLDVLSALENRDELIKSMQNSYWNELESMHGKCEEARKFFENKELTVDDLVGKSRGIWAWFNSFNINEDKRCDSAEKVIREGESLLVGAKAGDVALNSEIIAKYGELCDARSAYLKQKALFQNVKSLLLLFDLKEVMDEIRERDDKFFLSDTNYEIYSEIRDAETPFIYEKIGNRYRHFFIDEFQDTSRMQWEDIVPLLKNALAFPENQVILFGDVKQAIYRFRNGDSQLFADLTSKDEQREYGKLISNDESKSCWENVPLDTNYRSGGNVIAFNNLFFKHLCELQSFTDKNKEYSGRIRDLYETYYETVAQKIPEKNDGKGSVIVQFKGVGDGKEYRAEQVLAAVEFAMKECHFRQKDIAVLTSGRDLASDLGRVLAAAGYRVISSDSLLFCSSSEVNLLIAVLNYTVHPNDLLSRFKIMDYALHCNGDTEIEDWGTQIDILRDESAFLQKLEEQGIVLKREKLDCLSLYEILLESVKIFHINEADAFVIALMDQVLNYMGSKNGEVVSFLNWWEQNGSSLSLAAPAAADAITLSTIHASKGLQYPVVILPMSQYKPDVTKETFWYSPKPEDGCELPYLLLKHDETLVSAGMKEELSKEKAMTAMDNLNKIYVAHTRPKQLLYIITGTPRQVRNGGNYNLYIDDFIHGRFLKGKDGERNDEADEKALEVQPAEEEGKEGLLTGWREVGRNRFLFGEARPECNAKDEMQGADSFSKMYCSGFQLSQLSSHLLQTETPEQQMGNAIHDYFSHLREFPLTEAEVEAWTFDEGQPYPEEIRAALRTIAADEHWHPYFAPGVRVLNEIPILPTASQLAEDAQHKASRPQLTFRPDRVVLLPDETVVIDYKTGHPTEQARDAYERQVARYVELLESMDFPNVKGEILYFG